MSPILPDLASSLKGTIPGPTKRDKTGGLGPSLWVEQIVEQVPIIRNYTIKNRME